MPLPRILYLLLACTGASSLIFEVVWTRLLLRILGANVFSTGCVLAAFMTGLAIGGWLTSRVFSRRQPYRVWAIAEAVCGISGAIMPFVLASDWVQTLSASVLPAESNESSLVARFFLAFLLLLIPTTAMGMSYPIAVQILKAQTQREHSGALYSSNIAGAFIGAVFGCFFLLPLVGSSAASALSAMLNLLVMAILARAAKKATLKAESPVSAEAESQNGTKPEGAVAILLVSALSGAGVMMLELAWSRVFASAFGSSVYSSGIVFAFVLAGLSAGAAMAPAVLSRHINLLKVLWAALVGTVMVIYLTARLPEMLGYSATLLSSLGLKEQTSFVLSRCLPAAVMIFPATAFIGTIFPFLIHGKEPAQVRRVYVSNCLGAAAGALLGSVVIMPWCLQQFHFGMLAFMVVALLLFAACAVIIAIVQKTKMQAGTTIVLVGLIAALLMLVPPGLDERLYSAGWGYLEPSLMTRAESLKRALPEVLFYKEGLNSTVSLTVSGNSISLRTDGKVESTLPVDPYLVCVGADIATHTMLGALPVILCSDPENALLIGYGSGLTADAMLSFGLLKSLDVAELEPAVVDAADYLKKYRSPYFDSTSAMRPDLILNDGRYVLSSSRKTWSVIACQAAEPRTTGAADLYTKEFWQLVRSRLSPNGICSQWLQLYAMPSDEVLRVIKTFQSVFPKTYACHVAGAGEIILVGMKDDDPVPLAQVEARIRRSCSNSALLPFSGVTSGAELLALFKSNPENISVLTRQSTLNRDDHSKLEFECGYLLAGNEELIERNLSRLLGGELDRTGSQSTVPFDFLDSSGDPRLVSKVAIAMAQQAASGALGSEQSQRTAQALAALGLKNPCSQTRWNATLINQRERAASVKTLNSLKNSQQGNLADSLAIAQCNFILLDSRLPGKASIDSALSVLQDDASWEKTDLHTRAGADLIKAWSSLRVGEMLHGFQQASQALRDRPEWPAALNCRLAAVELSSDTFLPLLHESLLVEPWNESTHLIATRYFLERQEMKKALKHAINNAMCSGRGDGFILLLNAHPNLLSEVLPLYERFAAGDQRLLKIRQARLDTHTVAAITRQAEQQISDSRVSGYKKLGFPW